MKQETEMPPNTPKNLLELLAGDQEEGYHIHTGYHLELEHGLAGFFSAQYKATERSVVAFDETLIRDVWQTLTPRKSKLGTRLYYANFQTGVCYPLIGTDSFSLKESEPNRFLTREEFMRLTVADPHPFEWAPGLISDDMSAEEFLQALSAAG